MGHSCSGISFNGAQLFSPPGSSLLSDSKGSVGHGAGAAVPGSGSILIEKTETVVMIIFLNLFFIGIISFLFILRLKKHASSLYQDWKMGTRDRVVKKALLNFDNSVPYETTTCCDMISLLAGEKILKR